MIVHPHAGMTPAIEAFQPGRNQLQEMGPVTLIAVSHPPFTAAGSDVRPRAGGVPPGQPGSAV
jgi:hypothetical protein